MPEPDGARRAPSMSVALCTYNGERYLNELLESLVDQKHRPDELVVCDDRSTDASVALVESFAARAPFPVRINIGDHQRGPAANFGWAMSLCSGELIALCDQDDVWLPEKLARAAEAFAADPSLGMTFSDAELVNEQTRPQKRCLWEAQGFSQEFREKARRGDLLPLLALFTFVTGSTMTVRADVRDVALPIPTGWFHDAWLAMIASALRPYRMLDEPLMQYRTHPDQEIGIPGGAVTSLWKVRWRIALDVGKADVHRQRRRVDADRWRKAIERYRTAGVAYLERNGLTGYAGIDAFLADLESRARHSALRGALPDRRSQRLPLVLAELRTGRYRRYSAGMLSALQDVLY